MSALEAVVQLTSCAADVIEIAALAARTPELERAARAQGWALPALRQVCASSGRLALAVRPGRWLLLSAAAAAGVNAARWRAACSGCGAAVDLSSGLSVLHLGGEQVREVLARGCRLDLDPRSFLPGCAAATILVQVSVILAALPSGVLLLTPSSTAQHVREWLAAAGRPFGFALRQEITVDQLLGELSR